MTTYTQGKWIYRGNSCVGTANQLVACVYPMEDERPQENAANARLIAAAPDLLEALKLMVEIVELVVPFEGASMRRARAAITKATGESE